MNTLLEAVVAGNFDKVKETLDSGAWVGTYDEKGNTGLHLSALYGYPEIGKLFIDHGLFVNRTNFSGEQSLHLAANAHHADVVDMLMTNGAAILAVDYDGNSPLHFAVQNHPSREFVEKILAHGADVNGTNHENKTAFDYVQESGDVPVMAALVSHGAQAPGWADILVAAIQGDAEAVQAELDNGAWYGAVDANVLTGLHFAAILGYPEVAELFLAAGISVNRTDAQGEQPLHLAVQSDQFEMVELLLDHGAAILAVDYAGNTPLHYAVQADPNVQMVERLVAAGADVNAKNKAGESVLALATEAGQPDVISILLDHGAVKMLAAADEPIFSDTARSLVDTVKLPAATQGKKVMVLAMDDVLSDNKTMVVLPEVSSHGQSYPMAHDLMNAPYHSAVSGDIEIVELNGF